MNKNNTTKKSHGSLQVMLMILTAILLHSSVMASEIKGEIKGEMKGVIKGVVKDSRKKPVAAVRVTLKNTGAKTLTGKDGKFTLPVATKVKGKSVVLVFMRKGFHPEEKRVLIDNKFKTFRFHFILEEYLQHKVAVTALNIEKKPEAVPMAGSTVSELEIQEKIAENITETLSDTAGVHFIGKGGHTVTPSIRGLARRRVLLMVDGARVTSDRRVGASASFVPTEIIRKIEVVRSASSVIYGSDAMGGVVNILTRKNAPGPAADSYSSTLNLKLNSINKRVNTGFTYTNQLGKLHILSGFQYSKAGNYSSPEEEILNSGYTNFAGIMDLSYIGEKREFFAGYIAGFGRDVGKPERDNDPEKYSFVPTDNNQLFRLGYKENRVLQNGTFNVNMYLNPTRYTLNKVKTVSNTLQRADTTSLNLGIKAFLYKPLGKTLNYQVGLEWYSRQG
ncbi:MAG: TonB-dependent receptor plug domain-containing protein, partial [bacterium]|nr:TonB-dependent receptor plug domain-containing protein [bacterium]